MFDDDDESPLLTREDILAAWRRLGELAHDRGSNIEMVVVGGAVMTVLLGQRESTRDVDAVFAPSSLTRELAAIVAIERGWPTDWLNDGAKPFLVGGSRGPVLLDAPGIQVRSVALEQLLALKLMAWRDDVDFQDAVAILRNLRADLGIPLDNRDEVLELVEKYFTQADGLRASYNVVVLLELVSDDDDG